MSKNKLDQFFNGKQLAEHVGVHYRTVINWWRKNKIDGAFRSAMGRDILIPRETAEKLKEEYAQRVKPTRTL